MREILCAPVKDGWCIDNVFNGPNAHFCLPWQSTPQPPRTTRGEPGVPLPLKTRVPAMLCNVYLFGRSIRREANRGNCFCGCLHRKLESYLLGYPV
jgi:hypothetical protein